MGDFKLNTESMDESAKSCQDLAKKMRDFKQELAEAKSTLMFSWEGEGCNEFEKQFRLLVQQLEDVTDNLWDTGERILAAEEAYIQTDTDAAKRLEGVSQGVVTDADDQIASVYEDEDSSEGGGGSW